MDTFLNIFSYMLVLDSLGALWIAVFGRKWFIHNFHGLSRFFPPAIGWATLYFIAAVLFMLSRWGVFS